MVENPTLMVLFQTQETGISVAIYFNLKPKSLLSSKREKLKQIQKVKQNKYKNKIQAEQKLVCLTKQKVKSNYLGKAQRRKRNLGNSKGFKHR